MVDVALFDLDGVVRRFSGTNQWPDVSAIAFDPGLLEQAVTGKITDEEWRTEVLRRLGPGSAGEVEAGPSRVARSTCTYWSSSVRCGPSGRSAS